MKYFFIFFMLIIISCKKENVSYEKNTTKTEKQTI